MLLSLLHKFQESGEFKRRISERSPRDYIKQTMRIERAFGDFPIKALDDKGRGRCSSNGATSWRRSRCDKLTTLTEPSPAFFHGRPSGLIDTNPCAEGGKLYSGSRVDKVWSDEAGIEGLTFHDLRGTAVVRLARAGCTEAEI